MVCPILTAAEGFVLGVGAKMFTIAGPVIVYGTVASVVYGVIYWITTLFYRLTCGYDCGFFSLIKKNDSGDCSNYLPNFTKQ